MFGEVVTLGVFNLRLDAGYLSGIFYVASGLLKLTYVQKSPGNLVKMQTLIREVWDRIQNSLFLTSSLMMFMLPITRPHS